MLEEGFMRGSGGIVECKQEGYLRWSGLWGRSPQENFVICAVVSSNLVVS